MKFKISIYFTIFALLFVSLIKPVPALAAVTLDVKLDGSTTINKGEIYTLNINLPNISSAVPPGLMAFEINVKFDNSKFDFKDAINKTGISKGFSDPELIESNVVKLNFVNSNNPIKGTTFCSVQFISKTTGSASFTGEVLACDTFTGGKREEIPFKVTNRTVTIKEYYSPYLKSLSTNLRSISFNKTTTSYKINVGNSYKSIDISAQTEDSKATISISGGNNLSIGKINLVSGVYKCTVSNLAVGDNKISIVVKAQDGSSTTYYLTVHRYAANSQQPTSTPAKSNTPTKSAAQTPTLSSTPNAGTETPTTEGPTDSETAEFPAETPGAEPSDTDSQVQDTYGPLDPPLETPPGVVTTFFETFLDSYASIIVGLFISMTIGLAIGYGIGYYVGRRKASRNRFY